ncbi:3-deoxy-D-manno-octulosonic acid transferase [Variovorax sp. VNK109]|uniref:3-deoxy-D-manno-octulosonic acid transferase n=1 Tax=Variovorax sp. VNK109 TaxID=3400919 RepID=UPI003C121C22
MRALYSLLMTLGQPFLRRKLRRRGQKEPGYLEAVEERFGRYGVPPSRGSLWVHAVSLGETRAAAILLERLRKERPELRLLLTHGTATGRAEGARLLQPGDVQVWQPWDTPRAVQRFIAHFRPCLGILMETEIWPNLVAHCKAEGVPLVLANARLNEKSFAQSQRLSVLSEPAFESLTAVWAQTGADAERLRALGAPVRGVFGNLKFDASPDSAQLLRGRQWAGQNARPVVMLASSREGEEALLRDAVAAWRQRDPAMAAGVQWLIVPRHPQRFDDVAALVRQRGLTLSRRSEWKDAPEAADVWLGDSLGEMALYYGLSTMALLGGSFEPLGGQNLIEAAACGCPVIMGPSTFNFAEAAGLAEEAGAALRVDDMPEAVDEVARLLADRPALFGHAQYAMAFATAHRGAASRTVEAVLALLDAPASAGKSAGG